MDYEALRKMRMEQNACARLMGAQITKIEEGYAKVEVAASPVLLNPQGSMHGGCLFTLCDIAGSSAAVSHGYQIATVDADIRYLNAGIGLKRATAQAREIKRGKKLLVYQIDVTDDSGKLLVVGMFSYMPLDREIVLEQR